MLTSEKVRLRPKKLSDVYQDYLWSKDPELAELDGSLPLALPFSEYYRLYSQALTDTNLNIYRFAIETSEGKHIGNCMIYRIEGELWIMIGDKEHWNKGFGSAAIKLLLDFCFQ